MIKILVVDDFFSMRNSLKLRLYNKYKGKIIITEASTIKEANEQITKGNPNVIVSDLRLPDSSPSETLEFFKNKKMNAKLVFCSAIDIETNRELILKEDDFADKLTDWVGQWVN